MKHQFFFFASKLTRLFFLTKKSRSLPLIACCYLLLLPLSAQEMQDTANMVFVKGGTFDMGSTQYPNEMPVHSVTLDDFWIDKYEVSVAEYRSFCEATGRAMPEKEPAWGWKDDYPMVNVSWLDAEAYAQYVGKRLPTEAEWEYAARGGSKSNNYLYAGAPYAQLVGWFEGNSANTAQPRGLKKPNELGIYDMSGNVWEWCQDYYASYPSEHQTNPKGPKTGINRVIRGGSWFGNAANLRVANRYYSPEGYGSSLIGFRLVKDAQK
jgi:formylglycine-generating enzyme required for sulfatase activity